MNTSQLLSHHDQICEAARNLMVKKNADYAEAEAPFKNFELSERLGLCSTEAGMAIRLSDKIQRLCGFLAGKELKVQDESVQDTILDAVNYLVLISARLKQREEQYAQKMNETVNPVSCREYYAEMFQQMAKNLDRKLLLQAAPGIRERCGQCFTEEPCLYAQEAAPYLCAGNKAEFGR